MSSEKPSVILIGAGGNIGREIVAELLQRRKNFGRLGILAAPERAQKFEDLHSENIELILGSYFDATPFTGFEIVLCLLGGSTIGHQPKIIDAALSAGCTHFYPSELNGDLDYMYPQLKTHRYMIEKYTTRAYLREKSLTTARSLKYTIILTGAFTEWVLDMPSAWGIDTHNREALIYGSEGQYVTMTGMKDIARFTVESLLLPFNEGSQERQLRTVGGKLTWKRIFEILEEMQGPWKVQYRPIEEAFAKTKDARAAGDEQMEITWSIKTLIGMCGNFVPEPWDNGLFDFTPQTAEQGIRRFIADRGEVSSI